MHPFPRTIAGTRQPRDRDQEIALHLHAGPCRDRGRGPRRDRSGPPPSLGRQPQLLGLPRRSRRSLPADQRRRRAGRHGRRADAGRADPPRPHRHRRRRHPLLRRCPPRRRRPDPRLRPGRLGRRSTPSASSSAGRSPWSSSRRTTARPGAWSTRSGPPAIALGPVTHAARVAFEIRLDEPDLPAFETWLAETTNGRCHARVAGQIDVEVPVGAA